MAMEYRNLMEDIVLQNLDTVMEAEGGCTCDACKSDVVAALSEAPVMVAKTPRHGRE